MPARHDSDDGFDNAAASAPSRSLARLPAGVEDDPVQYLVTARDWLRYGVSRFTAEGLVFGHGTTTAVDEAAYLLLHTLHLPIETIEPWLEARLTPAERARLLHILELRISTRKPAPYLTREAWMHGLRFYVDERVIVPRSFIGELLRDGLSGVAPENPDDVRTILDLCTGSGCLAILAARAFPRAHVDATDISADALAVARRNVEDYALSERIRLVEGDLFQGLAERRYDLIVANPPYVSDAVMDVFPPEYTAEPLIAHAGGPDGLALVRRILDQAGRHLEPSGHLIVEIGANQARLEAEFPAYPFHWLDTEHSEGEVFALPATALEAPGAGPPRGPKLAERVRGSRPR